MVSTSSWRIGSPPARVSKIPEPSEERTRTVGQSENLYRAAWALYLLLAIAAAIWIGLREKGIPATLFVPDNLRDLSIDIAVAVGLTAMLISSWHLSLRWSATIRRLDAVLAEHIGDLPADRLVAVAVLSGFAEEFFFRGAVQGSFGLIWASLLFGLCHLGPVREARWWAVYATAAGLLFGLALEFRGSLLAPALAHILINAIGLRRLSRQAAART